MPDSRLLSVRDLFVISCHDVTSAAEWNDSQDSGGCRCSVCDSVHPDEFIAALKDRRLRGGWHWGVKDEPIRANLVSGVFFAEHLKDMSVEWLYANAIVIFEATGVLFYWERERLQFQPVRNRVHIAKNAKLVVTEAEIENAIHLNRHHYVTR